MLGLNHRSPSAFAVHHFRLLLGSPEPRSSGGSDPAVLLGPTVFFKYAFLYVATNIVAI